MSPLREPQLDDRTFQSLVGEARTRIARTCPEWTDHNVSDPGVTLIELFAWMTEMLVYRINQLPREIHLALLDLVGIELDAPSAAQAGVRFRLAGPATAPVRIEGRRAAAGSSAAARSAAAGGPTEVATQRTATEEPVVFEVDETFVIRPLRLVAYALQRGRPIEDVGVRADGEVRPQPSDQRPFSVPPGAGDALYLGFAEPLDRLVVALEVTAMPAQGAGVNPRDPPLRWEVSTAGGWDAATVLADGTGGFNYGSGIVELQLPAASAATRIASHDHAHHWLRCTIDAAGPYTAPPRITRITATAVGALLQVSHAATVREEPLGHSDGTPSQSFRLRHLPALELDAAETLEVRTTADGSWERWMPRSAFARSGPSDRHFMFDAVNGEIRLGPAIRADDGEWHQHGAIPRKGAALRMGAYRHGGGRQGNVAANTISSLRTSIKGVVSVTNPAPARGGVDVESLERAQERAANELRAGYRAVTAEDFAYLATENRRVARAVCVELGDRVAVHVLPTRSGSATPPAAQELQPPPELLADVRLEIDQRRLLGMSLLVAPVETTWVSVAVDVRVARGVDAEAVKDDVAGALYAYLDPWTGGVAHAPQGPGWPFGRALTDGELHGLVQGVGAVEAVANLHMYRFDPVTQRTERTPIGPRLDLGPAGTLVSGRHDQIRVLTA